MLKRLRRVSLWIAWAILIAGTSVFVAYEQHRSSEIYEGKRAKYCGSVSLATEQQNACKHERDNREDYMPWWYVFVAWPEGITTWAIIGTGFVIAWQTYVARRVAEISQKALVLEYRPRVIVRTLKLTSTIPGSGGLSDWRIDMVIANVGGTTAYLDPWSLRMEWDDPMQNEKNSQIAQLSFAGLTLVGGESRGIEAAIAKYRFGASMRSVTITAQKFGSPQRRYPVASGTIVYTDDNKITRKTGFRRRWDAKEERFTPSTDPEFEYQD